jgi:hypothetical protein
MLRPDIPPRPIEEEVAFLRTVMDNLSRQVAHLTRRFNLLEEAGSSITVKPANMTAEEKAAYIRRRNTENQRRRRARLKAS